jgi:hypothetical protein
MKNGMNTMKLCLKGIAIIAFLLGPTEQVFSQSCPPPGENECSTEPGAAFPCCTVWDACNGPYSVCQTYDPAWSHEDGCDLSCTPIDSGVLFLLLGGAAFGGMMIVRRKRESLQIV